jgi:hypothetical protein
MNLRVAQTVILDLDLMATLALLALVDPAPASMTLDPMALATLALDLMATSIILEALMISGLAPKDHPR